ncbi:MAG: DinB family protein [Gemmatimonadales bacterium]
MSSTEDFADQVGRIAEGDPWYGPSINEVLASVTTTDAAAHPIPDAHSIWELTLHLTAWVVEVQRRLALGVWQAPEDGDWPAPAALSAANWNAAVNALIEAHAALAGELSLFPEDRLDESLGGTRDQAMGSGQTYRQMLHGLLQHDAYHLGQISLLKKALGRG